MFKQFKILFILLLIFIVPFQIFSQGQKVTIEIIPISTLSNAQVLYFSNFHPSSTGNPQYLFDIIVGGLKNAEMNGGRRTNLELVFKLNNQVVVTSKSNTFYTEYDPNNSYTATNIQLINNHQLGDLDINHFTSSFTPPDDKFKDGLYRSGKAQSGQYKLEVTITVGNEEYFRSTPLQVIITNPSNIQLSDPGNRAGSGPPQEIMTEFPVFSFFTDGTYNPNTNTGTEYALYIYEKLSHHRSIEDVINSGNPIYPIDPTSTLTSTVLNYADGGGQPLQIGSTYYWFVDVLVPTTAGIETFRSEVYQFKVVSVNGNPRVGQAVTSIIELLRPVVGNEADNLSKSLTNFGLKTIRINGKIISIYEFQQIIENYEGNLPEISELALY